ncbi:MAG: bifunctional metallophosphatase/5'-nucleotidase [Deltaproteobacteria bacterium]|jgi:5'-nucleotidase|nr:bifunctional metallophosphatase/5'-nucleotidase [Deltaproteobacteria bacterium]
MRVKAQLKVGYVVAAIGAALLVATALTAFLVAAPPPQSANFYLTILHTNDVHAHYGGFTADGKICYASICRGGYGGSLRLKRAIDSIKGHDPDALLVDAGDQFMGSLFWSLYKEKAATTVMNAIGYQFFVPGNNDFIGGLSSFQGLIEGLKAKVISSNFQIKDNKISLNNLFPYIVIEINNRKVGLIGLTLPDSDEFRAFLDEIDDQPFELVDEVETLQNLVQKLTNEGVDVIVAITHLGLERDIKLAEAVKGVDIIVGGHTHQVLGKILPNSAGPYPIVVDSPNSEPVLVVTAGSRGLYLGRLTVNFDAKGRATSWSGETLSLDAKTLSRIKAPPEDENLKKYLDQLSVPIKSLSQETIGQIVSAGRERVLDVNPRACRLRECRSGDALTSALLASSPGAQIALVNGGTVRNSLPVGPVSKADVLSAFPFDDYVCRAKISGEELIRVLERSVAELGIGTSGRFFQVAGLRVTYAGRPGEWRVNGIQIQDGDSFRPLDLAAKYELVSLDFLANGGDGYKSLKKLNWQMTNLRLTEVFINYLKKGPLMVDFEPRITFISKNP